MPAEKLKKIMVASTVAGILLLITLLSIAVYQLISIGIKKGEEAYLNEQIAIYQQMKSTAANDVEICSQKWWIEQRARELGYFYGTDIPLE